MTKQPLLLIGATGLIGSTLGKLLKQHHYEVHVILRHQDDAARLQFKPDAIFIGDLLNLKFLSQCMSHIQFILYFAISSIPSDSPLNPIHEITNTLPSLHLLLEAMSGTNKHLIYPSSAGSVYGNRNENAIELTPLKPSSSYALGKVFSEDMIKFYGSINKIQYSILRFSNIYGSITRRKRLQGIIDHFLDNTILQKKSSVWGSLDTSRDFLYVEDAASAILEIIKAPSHAINEIYNIASGKAYRIQDVLEIIQEITEGQHQYETSVGNFTGPVQTLIDVKKFKNAYPNWQLRFDLYQGILRSWQQKINSLKGVQHDADD